MKNFLDLRCSCLLVMSICLSQIEVRATDESILPSELRSDGQLEWRKIEDGSMLEVLKMLALSSEANYRKIHSWEGRCSVKYGQSLPPDNALRVPSATPHTEAERLLHLLEYSIEFLADVDSGSVRRSKKSHDVRFLSVVTGKEIDVVGVVDPSDDSVWTSEHFLHMDPEMVWPGFGFCDHPEAVGKRALFRDSPEMYSPARNVGLFHPCHWFCLGPNQKFWELSNVFINALQHPEQVDESVNVADRLKIYRADRDGVTWYRTEAQFSRSNPSDPDGFLAVVANSKNAFNPVLYSFSAGGFEGDVIARTEWQWEQVGDVFLPRRVVARSYSVPGDAAPTIQWDLAFEGSKINVPTDAKDFGYDGLNLKDGDLVIDNIEKVVYTMKGGSPVKLSAFDEKYVPSEQRTESNRTLVLTGNVILVIALIVVLFWRMWPTRRPA